MQVELTSKHGEIKDSVRDLLIAKSEKLLTYFERVTAIQVVVDFEGERIKVEILVDAEHRHNFVASDTGEEVQSTFDSTLHKMEQQIRKYKQKLQDHRKDRQAKQIIQSISETEASETEASETEASETEASETEASETEASETEASETEASETEATE